MIEKQLVGNLCERLKHLQEETDDMPLEPSMWGVAVIIGIEQLGKAASWYLAFLVMLTVSMQTCIIVILGTVGRARLEPLAESETRMVE